MKRRKSAAPASVRRPLEPLRDEALSCVAGGGSRKAGEKPMKYLTITLETALSP